MVEDGFDIDYNRLRNTIPYLFYIVEELGLGARLEDYEIAKKAISKSCDIPIERVRLFEMSSKDRRTLATVLPGESRLYSILFVYDMDNATVSSYFIENDHLSSISSHEALNESIKGEVLYLPDDRIDIFDNTLYEDIRETVLKLLFDGNENQNHRKDLKLEEKRMRNKIRELSDFATQIGIDKKDFIHLGDTIADALQIDVETTEVNVRTLSNNSEKISVNIYNKTNSETTFFVLNYKNNFITTHVVAKQYYSSDCLTDHNERRLGSIVELDENTRKTYIRSLNNSLTGKTERHPNSKTSSNRSNSKHKNRLSGKIDFSERIATKEEKDAYRADFYRLHPEFINDNNKNRVEELLRNVETEYLDDYKDYRKIIDKPVKDDIASNSRISRKDFKEALNHIQAVLQTVHDMEAKLEELKKNFDIAQQKENSKEFANKKGFYGYPPKHSFEWENHDDVSGMEFKGQRKIGFYAENDDDDDTREHFDSLIDQVRDYTDKENVGKTYLTGENQEKDMIVYDEIPLLEDYVPSSYNASKPVDYKNSNYKPENESKTEKNSNTVKHDNSLDFTKFKSLFHGDGSYGDDTDENDSGDSSENGGREDLLDEILRHSKKKYKGKNGFLSPVRSKKERQKKTGPIKKTRESVADIISKRPDEIDKYGDSTTYFDSATEYHNSGTQNTKVSSEAKILQHKAIANREQKLIDKAIKQFENTLIDRVEQALKQMSEKEQDTTVNALSLLFSKISDNKQNNSNSSSGSNVDFTVNNYMSPPENRQVSNNAKKAIEELEQLCKDIDMSVKNATPTIDADMPTEPKKNILESKQNNMDDAFAVPDSFPNVQWGFDSVPPVPNVDTFKNSSERGNLPSQESTGHNANNNSDSDGDGDGEPRFPKKTEEDTFEFSLGTPNNPDLPLPSTRITTQNSKIVIDATVSRAQATPDTIETIRQAMRKFIQNNSTQNQKTETETETETKNPKNKKRPVKTTGFESSVVPSHNKWVITGWETTKTETPENTEN